MRSNLLKSISFCLSIVLFKFCFCAKLTIFEDGMRASDVTATFIVRSLSECAVLLDKTPGSVAFNYNSGSNMCELVGSQSASTTPAVGWRVYAILGCKNLPTIANGNIIFTPKDEYTLLDTIGINCDVGYGAIKSEIKCLPTGEWENAICEKKISDCSEILTYNPGATSGIYTIKLWQSGQTLSVYCDMVTSGGGWTVFQRRIDGDVNFYRTFPEYEDGFGTPDDEFWLGLKYIKELADKGPTEIRTDMAKASGVTAFETHAGFSLSGPNYVFNIGSLVAATPGDTSGYGLSYNKGHAFTTKELSNCAVNRLGAWWYYGCTWSNLNGEYRTPGSNDNSYVGLIHYGFGRFEKLKSASMMLRRP
ncbi:ficolin-3-like [Ruditapes philippinarum]|uniref:ficolin-3-like n=1 Tax=Ruditapes philippinarum TaxID=129788 RepID=UPI00295AD628|nr:ficolin-3-like [Ruditapes philippinarum]